MTSLDELVSYYHLLRQHGLNDSHSGNASVRATDGVWISPTGCCADTLTAADLVYCSNSKAAPANASLDYALHQAIYDKRKDVNAVLHGHPAHAIALTLNGNDFKTDDFEGMLYFGVVPVVDIDYDHYFELSVEKISSALANNNIVIARGHGVYSCAPSLELAYKWISSLELSARISSISHTANNLKETN
ncbi:MAG: class II aldolase/adducin family protein [Proteobacteria bacterium]|nr:class II aldolase/adducin family protein [Pseudomonadota bacterium]